MIGDGHIDSLTCCALEFVPEIGVYAGCFCFLSIGLDRLISVSLVAFYRNINRRLYLAIHLMAICIFASYAPFLVFKYYEPHRVICSLPQSFHGEGKRIWMRTILVVNILTLVLYALTWRILRCREESSYTKRVFRAIAPVMIFDVGGWLTAVALSKLIHNIDISGQSILVLLKSCGCIVHSVISVKPIIYYNTSTEYRNIIRAMFGFDIAQTVTKSNRNSVFGNYPGLTIMIGDGYIDSLTCCAMEFLPEIGVYAGCFCVLSMGLDRLISVSMAVFYRNVNRRRYLAVLSLFSLLANNLFRHNLSRFACFHYILHSSSSSTTNLGKIVWLQTMLVANVLTLIPYALTWRNLRKREDSSYTKRVFRAITLVMIFDVGGWLTAVALAKLIYTVDL
ncbi:hypothetical protein PMAYCL1PPCAC_09779 [Pristionchus mayeri]|uniref:G protein-coupled receptor n=1 Tax=Pristionchus mayeri TaxID=1317129 RepID=A0AAN4ZHM6_9BILA|nr:hypothetical protein PMAYCL1PPCAC_09779 [Pristionchus mayeri]